MPCSSLRNVALIAVIGALISSGAVMPPSRAAAGPDASTFVVLTRNQPRVLDPAIGADNPSRKVFVGAYEPLIDHKLGTVDVRGLEAVLAESWSISRDGRVYTFKLRRGVKFHDGTALDAEDVVVSFERMRKIGLGVSYMLSPIERIRAVDPMTVEITLAKPFGPFLLSLPMIMIVSADAVKKNEKDGDSAQAFFRQNAVGTGPYRVTDFTVGERIVMQRFADYWRGWRGCHLERVILRLVPEAATQRVLIEGGEGDWADTIAPDDMVRLASNPNFMVTSDPTWSLFYLMMNTKRPPLDNKLVRKAVRLAFPYQQLVRDVMRGRGTVPRGVLPPNFAGAAGKEEVTDFSRARALLRESGVPQANLKLDIVYFAGFDWERQGAELLAANLRPMGFDVQIRGLPWASMLDQMTDPSRRPHMAYFSADPETADPDSILYKTFNSKSKHWSQYGYANPEVDRLTEQARETVDQRRRMEMYKRVQEIIDDDSPAIFTLVRLSDHVLRRRVQGYVFHPPFGYGPINYYYLCLRS